MTGARISALARRLRPRSVRERAAGFTLIEGTIVVALIGMMAILAVPWFYKVSQRGQLRSDAYQIQSSLIAARMSAVRRNTLTTVQIKIATAADSDHELDTTYAPFPDPPPPLPTPTPLPPSQLFIASKRIAFVETPVGGVVTFRGDGTLQSPVFPTPAVYIVAGPVGQPAASQNQITIQADSSGRVRVITPANWK